MDDQDTWTMATGEAERENRAIVYRFRPSRPGDGKADGCKTALSILWKYDPDANNGMPPLEVSEQQLAFEDAIAHLGDLPFGYLVLVSTGDGARGWLFYVRDWAAWMNALNAALTGHPRYPLDIQHRDDPAWDEWSEFVSSVQNSRSEPIS